VQVKTVVLQLASLCSPTDPHIKAKVCELSQLGVRRLAEMLRHLANYVEKDLFAGHPLPALTDARFWPNSQTLLNIMRRASAANR